MSGKGKEGRVPQIRFAGFTDPWEQRKLGAMTAVLSAARVHKEEWQTEGVPFYRSSDVMSAFNGTQNEKVFISQELFDRLSSQSGAPQKGDVLVTGGGSVGTPYIVPDNKPLYTKDADLIWIKRHAMIDPEFLYSFFASPIFRAYIQSISHVGTIAHYTIEQVKETPLTMPCSIVEQKAIGSFLSNLDHLITLHQRKYDKLCAVKKSMLDKMFPKGGSLYPEIRFAGFTDPWEQRKFGDMYAVNNERNTNCELGYDRTLSIATMTFNGGNGAADDSLSNYKVIRVGDIAFEGHTNKVHAYGRFVLNDAGDGLMSPRFSCLRPIVEQRYAFWKYYIPREETMRPILVKATKSGTMMNELVPDDLMRESILVPCLAEQEVIGSCFTQLDHLITLHQRKLELLRNIKKAMLDKMFA